MICSVYVYNYTIGSTVSFRYYHTLNIFFWSRKLEKTSLQPSRTSETKRSTTNIDRDFSSQKEKSSINCCSPGKKILFILYINSNVYNILFISFSKILRFVFSKRRVLDTSTELFHPQDQQKEPLKFEDSLKIRPVYKQF